MDSPHAYMDSPTLLLDTYHEKCVFCTSGMYLHQSDVMSHQFLPLFGEPVSPLLSPRGGHCQYMEQLRRSIEHLRHQTSSASPCSLSTSSCDFTKRSISRISDTLGVNNRDSPDCMVVYEPYTAPPSVTPSSSGGSQGYHGYVSSSSGSCSSVDGGQNDDTPTNILEDSGVDLCDIYTKPSCYHGNDGRATRNSYDKVQHSPRDMSGDITHDATTHKTRHKVFRTFGKSPEQGGVGVKGGDKERKGQTGECLDYSRKKSSQINKRDMSKSSESLLVDEGGLWKRSSGGITRNNVKEKQSGERGDSCGAVTGKSMDKSTHTHIAEIGGVCFCAVEPRRSKNSAKESKESKSTASCHSVSAEDKKDSQNHNVKNSREGAMTKDNALWTSQDFDEIFIDTPVATPVMDDGSQDSEVELVTQSSQTDKSVLRRKKDPKSKKRMKNPENKTEFLRSNLTVIADLSQGRNESQSSGFYSEGDVVVPDSSDSYAFVREGSIRSMLSLTDTMSVTSMEVANIMAATEESQKSAVALEKERLRLQHQRLESYQGNMTEESTSTDSLNNNQNHAGIFDLCYTDESLRKQKIMKSVLETIPVKSPIGKTSGKSIHTFVAQSLQNFFTESKNTKTLGSSKNGAFKRNHPREDEEEVEEESTQKRNVVSPSLYQLTTAFRLFHVSYGDPGDLLNMRLITCEVKLDQRSSPGSSSPRRRGGQEGGNIGGEPGSSRLIGKTQGVRYTFLVIAELRNHRMEMDDGGIQPGDHIIEMNDSCMLNQTPEIFFEQLEQTKLVHLVIGRRRHQLRNLQRSESYGDSCML